MSEEKKNVNIWKALQKVPAGTMFVPLIIGAIITTIGQGLFNVDIWAVLGNPMKDMFSSSGQMLIIGLMLFFTGTGVKVSDLKSALGRSVPLIIVRLVVAYTLCALYYVLFGFEGVFGIPFLAVACAITSANAALYMGIISPFGDEADKAGFGIMLICSMPLLPILFLGFYGTSGFGIAQVMQIIALLIPFILGMILGSLDADIRKVFAGGNATILPFLGFEFGSTINLFKALGMIPQGILLSIAYFIIVIGPSYFVERNILHRPGYISVASASLAGIALAIPAMADTDKLAFSTVTKFDHSVKEQTITNVEDIKTLKAKLQPIVDQNKNIFYMFLAHAKFSKMHVRSCYKCAKPYPTHAETACEQREYHYENEEGQIIAIYCPDYVEGINLPGWHFHFLSDDKTHGGHILGLSADEFTFKMNAIPEFDLVLLTDSDFGKLNLTEDLSESTNAVEGN